MHREKYKHSWTRSPFEKAVLGFGTGSSPKYFLISVKMGKVSSYQVPIKQTKFGVHRCRDRWHLGGGYPDKEV